MPTKSAAPPGPAGTGAEPPRAPPAYLVVGAPAPPAESERFLLQVLAEQAGVALTNARLHSREREQAEELRLANLALVRSM